MELPCGKCLGCRVTQAQVWATRIMHESQSHAESQFVTLTYNPEHAPRDVSTADLRNFLKRLRAAASRAHPFVRGNKLRYFAAGEYGDRTGRPHYHVCLFGLGFRDEARYSDKLVTSPTLTEIWGMGHVRYGRLTHQSAAYVAGYAGGKAVRNGHFCDGDTRYLDYSTGEIKRAPFMRCSNRPGIGYRYAEQNLHSDIRSGRVYSNGRVSHPPRYYRACAEKLAPARAEECDSNIYERSQKQDPRHRTAEALTAKLVVAQQRFRERQRNAHL